MSTIGGAAQNLFESQIINGALNLSAGSAPHNGGMSTGDGESTGNSPNLAENHISFFEGSHLSWLFGAIDSALKTQDISEILGAFNGALDFELNSMFEKVAPFVLSRGESATLIMDPIMNLGSQKVGLVGHANKGIVQPLVPPTQG